MSFKVPLTVPVEELCKNLDRVCGELGRLLYVLRVNEVDTDMDTSQAEALKATIEAAASDGETITLERVVYGDVFFCSGQVANKQRAVPRSLENQPASGH